jgi:hypothetical protein
MAILNDLPNELLIDVVAHLKYAKQSLLSLALVSRRFSSLVSPLIFGNISLDRLSTSDPSWSKYDGAGVNKKTKDLLLRSLRENAALCKNVRSCGPINIMPIPHSLQHGVDSVDLNLLDRCSNLEEMHIYCHKAHDEYRPSQKRHSVLALLSRLQHLEAISLAGYPRLKTIAACLLAPGLRSLSVNNVLIVYLEDEDRYSDKLPLPNNEHACIRKLAISGDQRQRGLRGICHTSTLNRLLRLTPGLEELHLDLPLGFEFRGFPPPEYNFTAVGIADALRPLRETLTVLQLTVPWIGLVRCFDVPIDLSDLVRVRVFTTSALCFLPLGEGTDGRETLYLALPINVETLHVGILETAVCFQHTNLQYRCSSRFRVPCWGNILARKI